MSSSSDSDSGSRGRRSSKSGSSRRRHSRSRSRSPNKDSKHRGTSRSRSRSRDRSSKHRKKQKKHFSRSDSGSDSGSDGDSDSDTGSSSDSDSSSESDNRSRKRKKKSKKRKKKDKKKKKKKHKKKKKKHKKKSKKKEKKSSLNLTQVWGSRGVLRDEDIHGKSQEFYAWTLDIKHIDRSILSRQDERELFAEFAEEWNCCTLPEKYYNLAKWQAEGGSETGGGGGGGGIYNSRITDEERVRLEAIERRERKRKEVEDARMRTMLAAMRQTKGSKDFEMKQQQLRKEKISRPTFESIARKREQEKADKMAEYRKRYK